MTRQYWRPANLLNPVPAVMISCADENGNANVMNAAWGGIYKTHKSGRRKNTVGRNNYK